jgi:hypothetical protein
MLAQYDSNHFFVRGGLSELIKRILPCLSKAIVLSDACAAQFKRKFNYHLVCKVSCDLTVDVVWYFGAPGKGKGDPDKEGGLLRIVFALYIANGGTITNFAEYVAWCRQPERILRPNFEHDPAKPFQIISGEIIMRFSPRTVRLHSRVEP